MKNSILLLLLIISLNGIGQIKAPKQLKKIIETDLYKQKETYSDTCSIISNNCLDDAGTFAIVAGCTYFLSDSSSEGVPKNTFRGVSFTLAVKSIDKLLKHRKYKRWSKFAKTGKDRKGRPFKLYLDDGKLKRVKERNK